MQKTELRSLYHCVYTLQYHLVIVTKDRKKCLTAPMLVSFERQAKARCEAWGGRLLEVNGEADPIHLLLDPLVIGVAANGGAGRFCECPQNMDQPPTSRRRLRNEFKEHLASVYEKPVLWSRSYCILTCGGAPLEIIQQYIQQQARPEK